MTHTPTPEQLQEFKDWYYHRYGCGGAGTGDLSDYKLCTAYYEHKLMQVEREPQELTNIETILRKLAALQEIVYEDKLNMAEMQYEIGGARQEIEGLRLKAENKGLKQQVKKLNKPVAMRSVCKHEYITDANWKTLTCRLCNDRIEPTQTVL